MFTFHTTRLNTPVIATHLLDRLELYFTPIGSSLRKTSLDKLPQLWSLWKEEDMKFVGPRLTLFNQDDLLSFMHQARCRLIDS